MPCGSVQNSLCANATSPAHIDTKTSFQCDGKCQFSYKLDGVDAREASNPGTYLNFKLSSGSNASASFNGVEYKPKLLQLYSPSLHEYNKQRAEAESILVLESPVQGNLYICTPLETGGSSGPVDGLITIATSESRIPGGSGTTIAINEKLDANGLCIDSKFFTYSGTGLGNGSGCDNNARYIVYAPPSKVPILPGSLRKLKSAIDQSCNHPIVTNQSVVVNLGGPGGSIAGGDIYIKCEPTGNSIETKEVAFRTVNIFDPANMGNVWSVIMGMFAVILMWAIWKAFEKLLAAVLGPTSMMPEVPQPAS
tara:strand:- start:2140 stop:3066 length:927 start_codon:yes stop_codon:yes gene_type:complete